MPLLLNLPLVAILLAALLCTDFEETRVLLTLLHDMASQCLPKLCSPELFPVGLLPLLLHYCLLAPLSFLAFCFLAAFGGILPSCLGGQHPPLHVLDPCLQAAGGVERLPCSCAVNQPIHCYSKNL